ncbi:RHS repeat-associated core domain-containing protein [Pseudomonas sp. NPDC096917]|uniref:RHS repeat-associated core domain-containing protein n=1 Tax=Pseudomonas sp. NPDC096917 TaxID=3364483 RepID=UPI00383B7723
MASKKKLLLHHYAYDPLDRHVKSGGSEGPDTQLFYKNNWVAVEIKGNTAYRIFETEDVALAQHIHTELDVGTTLIAHDDKRSTLATLAPAHTTAFSYTVAGYSPTDEHRVLGFNGERNDKTTGYYLLGNGYRAFNPVLMRFNSPDSWSPFGEGGINTYAYCEGDPVNRVDPTGHAFAFIKRIKRFLGVKEPSRSQIQSPVNHYADVSEELYPALLQKLEETERALAKSLNKGRKLEMEREANRMASGDHIAKLNALNSALLEKNQRLTQRLGEKRLTSRMPPPPPSRPNATLTQASRQIPVKFNRLDYLDLAVPNNTIRKN